VQPATSVPPTVDVFAGRVRQAYILGSEEPPPLDL